MKQIKYIVLAAVLMFGACTPDNENIKFDVDTNVINMAAEGGVKTIKIDAGEAWTASTNAPWITVSPANGRGSTECQIIVDSALTANVREAEVRITPVKGGQNGSEIKKVAVSQEGYQYLIELDEPEVELECYEEYDERYFEVTVRSNVQFDVKIPEEVTWLTNKKYSLELNRGLRPREVTIRFDWGINSRDTIRLADVKFVPKQNQQMGRQDMLTVRQEAAVPIKENTREGDSVALLAIYRTMRASTSWDTSQRMDTWSGITLWKEDDEGCTPEKLGRVRKAEFAIFYTKEALPYEVRFLTAAEELYFFGNANTFLLDLDEGESIGFLGENLKRLTIGAYGLSKLGNHITKLKNLEYLNICANNFQRVPDVLTKGNFPKLRSLVMNANQRNYVSDLSNTVKKQLGGFMDEEEFPVDLIKWDLDTLVLSVNYLHGSLPTFENDPDFEPYTQEDIANSKNEKGVDTLPQILVDRKIKKVMPSTKRFAINLNRLNGELPDWLLYHPALDLWVPFSLVFPQEGRWTDGTYSGFSNAPSNLNYYYDHYIHKDRITDEDESEEEDDEENDSESTDEDVDVSGGTSEVE